MKTFTFLSVAAFVLFSTRSFSQDQTSVFESASLTKAGDGSPCVQLKWKKGSENTAYYLVERSSGGKEFMQVALVFTSEDSTFSAYKYRDKNFAGLGNTIFYRIVIVNEQKELIYLPVRKVDVSMAETTSVAPVFTNVVASLTN
jgi:hypothetical protein